MAITPIDIGTTPNDGTGDPLRDAFNTINNNEATLSSDIGVVSNKTKSATTAILTAGSQTITFTIPFSDANYELVFMALDASGFVSYPQLTAQLAASFTVNLDFPSKITYIAHKN